MNRWRWLLAALVLIGTLTLLVRSEGNRAISSVVSRGEDGWYGFRQALERHNISLEVAKKPWDESLEAQLGAAEQTVWVVTFPWQRSLSRDELHKMSGFLRKGGTVWVAYSGYSGSVDEAAVLESLGLGSLRRLREPAPMSPSAWWRHRNERWELQPNPDHVSAGVRVEIPALDVAPAPPSKAEIYFDAIIQTEGSESAEDGSIPLIFGYQRLGGHVLAIPAVLWSNAEILTAGNLALLDRWSQGRGPKTRWWVDEYHHGMLHPDLVKNSASNVSWDLFFLHLALIYGLGVWALARRFGPVWHERPARFGSTAEFLENLGTLHHRLGHHRSAARHMVARMAELYPQSQPAAGSGSQPEDVGQTAEQVSDGPSLIHLAQELSAHRFITQKLSARKLSTPEPTRAQEMDPRKGDSNDR